MNANLDKEYNEKEIAEILFNAACSGEMETLKAYYQNGGKTGLKYEKFGSLHSLVAGAYRNGNFEIVRYLLNMGEQPEKYETDIDLKALYMDDVIKAAESLVDYFKYHNKTITKAQEEKINELENALRLVMAKD